MNKEEEDLVMDLVQQDLDKQQHGFEELTPKVANLIVDVENGIISKADADKKIEEYKKEYGLSLVDFVCLLSGYKL